MTVISARSTTAPEGSVIVPVIEELSDCAIRATGLAIIIPASNSRRSRNRWTPFAAETVDCVNFLDTGASLARVDRQRRLPLPVPRPRNSEFAAVPFQV